MNAININQLRSKISTVVLLMREVKNWPTFLYDFFYGRRIFPGQRLHYRFRNGAVMAVRAFTDDKWALTEVFMKYPYHHGNFHPWGSTPVIVDAGAHIGSFTIQTARAFPKARLLAIEPARDTFDLLGYNITLNRLKNVTYIRGALTSRSGETTIYTDPARSVFSSIIRSPGNYAGQTERVPAWTLERLIIAYRLPRIDFLKCDIEGGEFDLFFNLPDSVWKKIRNISLEYHLYRQPKEQLAKLQRVLTDHGFAILELFVAHPESGLLKAKRRAVS